MFAGFHLESGLFTSFLIPFGFWYCPGLSFVVASCFDGVTWFFFKEAISLFNRFISSSCLGFCVFSSSEFDVSEAVDLGLLWSRLFWLFIRSFWLKLLIGKFFLCCRCFRFISSFYFMVALISTRSLFSNLFFNSFCVSLIPSDTTLCFYHVMYAFRVNLHSIIAWISKELLAGSRWYGFYWYGFYCFRVLRFLLFSGKMLIHLSAKENDCNLSCQLFKNFHCGYQLMVPNRLLNRLKLYLFFGSVLWMCHETRILLFCCLNN